MSATEQKTRTAVITGAAAGLGREYATRLARAGHRLVLADIADLDETVSLVKDVGGEALAVNCDVGSPASIRALGEEVAGFGGADILVHNAGIFPFQAFEEIDLAAWRHVQAINVEALFLLTQAFLPTMRERKWGRIVGTTSGMFYAGVPGAVHYVASKGAVVGFVRGLAPEVGVDGVTVNAVAPGLIRTPGTLVGPEDQVDGMFEGTRQAQDIKRTGEPRDLAGAVAFLVSDEAAFMTGQSLLIDGGLARL